MALLRAGVLWAALLTLVCGVGARDCSSFNDNVETAYWYVALPQRRAGWLASWFAVPG
jgi:hypothetical protein